MAKSKRVMARLQLDPAAKRELDALCGRRGMTQVAVLARLVRWFGGQGEVVQASVLGLMSDDRLGELARVLVERAASGPAAGPAADAGDRAV